MTHIELTCSGCGVLFQRPLREHKQKAKNSNTKRFYCTRQCSDDNRHGAATSAEYVARLGEVAA